MASTTVKIPNLGASLDDVGTALGTTSSPTLIPEYMTATTVTGTPAAGKFYSEISGRAPMLDLSKYPSGKLGVERIKMPASGLSLIDGEVGPDGQNVYQNNDERIRVANLGALINDYEDTITIRAASTLNTKIEVVAYCTGLSILTNSDNTRTMEIKVDGVAQTNDSLVASTVLNGRGYEENIVRVMISGLAAGVHTISLSAPATNHFVSGFEILNESLTIGIPAGSITADGVTQTIATPTTTDLTTFDVATQDGSGVITDATKGGCVTVYIDTDGTVKKAINYADSSQGTLVGANVDHSNEEVVQKFNFREFGVGRADDFSTLGAANSNRAFTLDDGTTTLVGSTVRTIIRGGTDHIFTDALNSFITLTFVGTGIGLDVHLVAAHDTYTFYVDGVSIGTTTGFAGGATDKLGVMQVVSGLTYGTHTLKIERSAFAGAALDMQSFIIYAPKKPVLTTGQIELSCGYKMADFVAASSAGVETINSGVLRKGITREAVYGGTWTAAALSVASYLDGQFFYTDTDSDTVSYTFYGTGFVWRPRAKADVGADIQLTLDGSITDFSVYSPAPSYYGPGDTGFTASTGILDINGTTAIGVGVVVEGLPHTRHTIEFKLGATGTYLEAGVLDIITPYYAYKNDILNLSSELVGSNALQSKVLIPGATDKKIIAIAGIDAGKDSALLKYTGGHISITNTLPLAPISELRISVTLNQPGRIAYSFNSTHAIGAIFHSYFAIYVNGVSQNGVQGQVFYMVSANHERPVILSGITDVLPAGTHRIQLWSATGGGTLTLRGDSNTAAILSAHAL